MILIPPLPRFFGLVGAYAARRGLPGREISVKGGPSRGLRGTVWFRALAIVRGVPDGRRPRASGGRYATGTPRRSKAATSSSLMPYLAAASESSPETFGRSSFGGSAVALWRRGAGVRRW